VKAITIMPPFAQAVGRFKFYETRKTKVLQSCVGQRIAIACGKDMSKLYHMRTRVRYSAPVITLNKGLNNWDIDLMDTSCFARQAGCVIATADVVSCVLIQYWFTCQQTPLEVSAGWWHNGFYASKLANIEWLPTPIPARGWPGLWEWTP
jgi:hypothetical protein